MLFADDAAFTSHSEEGLQLLIDKFSHACTEFGLTISIKKTNIMGQHIITPPLITINNEILEVTEQFTYLGSTITSNLSLDKEIDTRIGKAAGVMAKLSKRVWENKCLTKNAKLKVYQACVLSTLLYGSESWTAYSRQENRLESFHLRCLRRILHISWQDKVNNIAVLDQAGTLSIHLLLCQRRLRWLGHVRRMENGRILKDILYRQLKIGHRLLGRPMLRFKDVCKRDMKLTGIDPNNWESLADDRNNWRNAVCIGLHLGETRRRQHLNEIRGRRKHREQQTENATPTEFVCNICGKDCKARIGLLSHTRHSHQI